MKYKQRSFTVPATGKTSISCEAGHAMPDARGRCIRCGENTDAPELRACTEKVHTFNGDQTTCACGTVQKSVALDSGASSPLSDIAIVSQPVSLEPV